MSDLSSHMQEIGRAAQAAATEMAVAPSAAKSAALRVAADAISDHSLQIIEANRKDIDNGQSKGLTDAMIDRLTLDHERIGSIRQSLLEIADLADPVGTVIAEWARPNGLKIKRVRTPLGVIGIIYESRPNVTVDAGALCLKAGNAAILRGGSDSWQTSQALHQNMLIGLREASLPGAAIQSVATTDRSAVGEMLRMTGFIDVIVPRGGKSLVERVLSEARVPVFAHLEGICHVYVDEKADVEKARRVVLNSKVRRTGICGAAECLLIDHEFFRHAGAPFITDLTRHGIEVRVTADLIGIAGTVAASDTDFGTEFLDKVIAVRLVDGVQGAIDHIQQFGSQHTDAIITESDATAEVFFSQLNSAILMRNASTQFADGGEFGMGAEIGIATGKIHARGPVGAEQLTSFQYIVEGDGTIRP